MTWNWHLRCVASEGLGFALGFMPRSRVPRGPPRMIDHSVAAERVLACGTSARTCQCGCVASFDRFGFGSRSFANCGAGLPTTMFSRLLNFA